MHVCYSIHTFIVDYAMKRVEHIQHNSMKILFSINKNCGNLTKNCKIERNRTSQIHTTIFY